MKCEICSNDLRFTFAHRVIMKHNVSYYKCQSCGYLRTEEPYWLDEAYNNVIAKTDTGILRRNWKNAHLLTTILWCTKNLSSKIIDLGGGYGVLTRILRDAGFNCKHTDPLCLNLFASNLEPELGEKFDIGLAFEVFEHIHKPVQFIQESFEKYNLKTFIFSTLPLKENIPSVDWWYYSFETGQHIAFYQIKTLKTLAHRLRLNYLFINPDLHLLSKQEFKMTSKFILNYKLTRKLIYAFVKKNKSLTWHDHEMAKSILNKL